MIPLSSIQGVVRMWLKAVWCTCAGAPPSSVLCELLMCDKEATAYCPKYVMTDELCMDHPLHIILYYTLG